MNRLSIQEQQKIADIYQEILEEDMDSGGLLGGLAPADAITSLDNKDNYAPGDTRIPKILGRGVVQTRKGAIKRKNKKRVKKA